MPSAWSATSPQRQVALAFLRPHLAEAEQPRQPAITVAVDRVSEQARRVGQDRAGSRSAAATPRLCTRCASAPPRRACCGRRSRSRPCRARAPSAPARSRPTRRAGRRRAWSTPSSTNGAGAIGGGGMSAARTSFLRAKPAVLGHQPNSPWMNQLGRARRGRRRSALAVNPVAAAVRVLDPVIIAQPGARRLRATIRARSARALRRARCHAPRAATRTAAACLRASHK